MREELLLDVPHRQVVLTIPKMQRIFFKYKRRLLGELCQAAVQALLRYFQATTSSELRPGGGGLNPDLWKEDKSVPSPPPPGDRGWRRL